MNTQPSDHSPTSSDDPVEHLLREQSSRSAPIPDDGFTARVLHALPQTSAYRSTPPTFLRPALIFSGALAGLLLAWSQTPTTAAPALWQDLSSAATAHLVEVLEWLSAPSQLITLVSVAATLAAIYLLEDHSQDSR